jgi:hypothetical protein
MPFLHVYIDTKENFWPLRLMLRTFIRSKIVFSLISYLYKCVLPVHCYEPLRLSVGCTGSHLFCTSHLLQVNVRV